MNPPIREQSDRLRARGEMNIIFVGDLFQLPPCEADCIYENRFGASQHLWLDYVHAIGLRQSQRQAAGSQFATHLNAVSDGCDYRAFNVAIGAFKTRKSRNIGGPVDLSLPEWREAPHLLARNAHCDSHNTQMLGLKCPGRLVTLRASYFVVGSDGC